MQPGDVADTAADITKSRKLLGFNPKTSVREGIRKFIIWYRDYYDL
jgi:UDP-glucuronate 4-epimerase